MSDIIQIAALATFLVAFFLLAMMVFREWRLANHAALRELVERERLHAEIGEILERTRIRKDKADGAWNGFRKFRVAKKFPKQMIFVRSIWNPMMVSHCHLLSPDSF